MSEVLARIRIRETHGIRRFLYPLSVTLALPATTLHSCLNLGAAVPFQSERLRDGQCRVDFAVSLAPYGTEELRLTEQGPRARLDDPLRVELATEKVLLWNEQQRFQIALGHDALHRDVIYDGVYFPHDLPNINCNGRMMQVRQSDHTPVDIARLSASVTATGEYADGRTAETHTEITAVKSWESVTHWLHRPEPNDEIVFSLPLAITSPSLTCDFGVGGYVFGKLDEKANEIVWRTEFGGAPYARWSVATAGRVDYVGTVESAEAFLPQRWFHLIDSDKALAVAITKLPDDCRELTVRMTREGDVSIAFHLDENITGPAEFGVCYHFLNDVPAIAAATNPQSILLPPVVEVLPV